jgi:diadenosine tetraphosphate (Ap4A) HIT family hydrolase
MYKEKLPLIFETEYWVVRLNYSQLFLGRSLIILKREAGDLAEVTSEELLDLHQIIQRMQDALQSAFGATMFNWACLMNNAYQEEDPKPQVHFHVWPRYQNPVTFGGHVFTDEHFGHYAPARTEGEGKLDEETYLKIINAIKNNLQNGV